MGTVSTTGRLIGHAEVAAFCESNVNLPHSSVTDYRARVRSLRTALESKIAVDPAYAVVRVREAGSLAKGTALRTTSDFDLALYVRPDQVPQDPSRLATWLVERLKEARPQLAEEQFKPRDHCISIMYKDGRKVDIVPILDAGDGSGDGDLIRQDTGARVRTNIPRQLEFIRTRKARLPVHYRQVIRLLKWWAEQLKREDDSVRFKSYLSELVCAHLLDRGVVFTSYPDALASIFSYIKTSGLTEPIIFADYHERATVPRSAHGIMTVIDPVNPSNNIVSDYTERNRQTIITAASMALDAIDFAEYAATIGEAAPAWAEILGPQFRGR